MAGKTIIVATTPVWVVVVQGEEGELAVIGPFLSEDKGKLYVEMAPLDEDQCTVVKLSYP